MSLPTDAMMRPRAFSLVEMMVTIAVLAVIAGIAIPVMSGILPTSRASVADHNLHMLNAAVHAYSQCIATITNTTSATDVLARLRTPDPLVPGTPFYPATTKVVETSDSKTYRARWDVDVGVFKFLRAGETGTGIDLIQLSGYSTNQ